MEYETNSTSLSAQKMEADLAELKDIESVISSQLNELGNKIDSSFAKAAQIVSSVTDSTIALIR